MFGIGGTYYHIKHNSRLTSPTPMYNPSSADSLIGMLNKAMWNLFLKIDMLNLALNWGSSKHGNAERAYVGSNWVVAKYLEYETFKNRFISPKFSSISYNSKTFEMMKIVH